MRGAAELEALAADVVRAALQVGASAAECTFAQGTEFEAKVRMGEVEALKEAGSSGAGVRVLLGARSGSAYTSDLSESGLRRMVASALELARLASEDPYAGLPVAAELGRLEGDLGLWSASVPALSANEKIGQARRAERAALDADPRIVNSEGAACSSYSGLRAFANSLGFTASYATTSCGLHTMPVARDGERMERDYWWTAARDAARLESPEQVGRTAARRALRRLGARKVATQKVPVVLEAAVARSLVGDIFDAVSGDSVYRQASFLAGKLDEIVASACVTVIDDATMPGMLGTSPFDDEGVCSRRTVVLDRGRLASYLLNTYTAKKLGLRTTGNAARGLSGNPGIGHGNLYLAAGNSSPRDIIGSVKEGLFVTELIGSGVNIVNGDYSRGAAGLWIHKGELSYAVHEVTIAGNLREMLARIEAVGTDLEFRGSVAAPTLLIGEMTVSGHSADDR